MPRAPVLAGSILLGAGLAVGLVASCGEDPPTAPPLQGKSPETVVATGTSSPGKPPRMSLTEAQQLWDETARKLLASFELRTYDPRRDAQLEHIEGTLRLREGDREGAYRFTYDAANPSEYPVKFDVVSEAEGLPKEAGPQAKRWALQACVGAFSVVAYFRPVTPLLLRPGKDPNSKNLVVWARAVQNPLNVSYSFDERQVVATRGEWTDTAHRTVSNYEWELWHGLYLMKRESVVQGAEIEFEYGQTEGVTMLERIHVREGSRAVEVTLTYDVLRRATK